MTGECTSCESKSTKYKCPVCYASYCSPICWKKHKDDGQCKKPDVGEVSPATVKERLHLTEDTVPLEKLHRLGTSAELKDLLKDAYLKKLITAVDNSPDPYESVQKAMQDPSFVLFVDKCLEMVDESIPGHAGNS